jgi:hypothetical protein
VQAQDHQVDAGHQFALGRRVLAPFGRDAHQLDLRHLLQPLPDLQAGGAGFAVNEDLGHFSSCEGHIICDLKLCNMVVNHHDTVAACYLRPVRQAEFPLSKPIRRLRKSQ